MGIAGAGAAAGGGAIRSTAGRASVDAVGCRSAGSSGSGGVAGVMESGSLAENGIAAELSVTGGTTGERAATERPHSPQNMAMGGSVAPQC